MSEIMKAETIPMRAQKDVYVAMVRYGQDFWSSLSAYNTPEEAEQAIRSCITGTITAWRIVRVSGLPIQQTPEQV